VDKQNDAALATPSPRPELVEGSRGEGKGEGQALSKPGKLEYTAAAVKKTQAGPVLEHFCLQLKRTPLLLSP
jgi:hypothetical protein